MLVLKASSNVWKSSPLNLHSLILGNAASYNSVAVTNFESCINVRSWRKQM
jgi:hypothetical protein